MAGRATHCAEAMRKLLDLAELHIASLCPVFVGSFADTRPHPHSSGRLHFQVCSMQRQLSLKLQCLVRNASLAMPGSPQQWQTMWCQQLSELCFPNFQPHGNVQTARHSFEGYFNQPAQKKILLPKLLFL